MDAQKIRRRMTLEQKAAFCSGLDFWHLHGVENIPPVMVTDGPHGLRKQAEGVDHLGLNESVKAICFPAGCALACSFDPELAERMGAELGKLAQAEDISAVLGPAMNIKRSPLCGRNFEYYSEDPLLSTKMASGAVKGIQSRHVGACPKHFLANNQEYYRMSSNSVVDEQTMREIYLASFEETVREANVDGRNFINALPRIAAVIYALRPTRCLQRSVGVSGPRRPPLLGVLSIVPVGGVLPMILPAAFAIRDAIALAVQVINLAALRPPASVRFQRANGQQNMSMGIAVTLVMERKVRAHPLCHKVVFDE